MVSGTKVKVTIPEEKPVDAEFIQFGWSERGVFAIVELEDGSFNAPYLPYVKRVKEKPKKVKK